MATEFLGGLALILGLWTRFAAIPIAFAMLVAIVVAHGSGGFFLPTGFEYPLTLLVINIGFVFTGSGAFALENVLFERLGRPIADPNGPLTSRRVA